MFAQHVSGGNAALSATRARALVFGNISDQAFVAAIADDFLIAAAITAICLIPILFLRVHARKNGNTAAAGARTAPALE
jgi:Mg/Co/Ni transporter MgtE